MAPTQRAIVIRKRGVAELVNDRPLPQLRDDMILVKTVAVALNPADWKHIYLLVDEDGPLVGSDYAGVVEAVGSKVTKDFKKGDRVCGVVHGCNVLQHEDGAFAEHIVARADVQMKIPDNISFEDAATLGAGLVTVALGLYQKLGLALPTSPLKEPIPILIYGGSSASGALGIQFAKLSGYTVITTCSPHNFDLVKSYGADLAVDYRDPDCAKKIRDFAGNKLTLAWDTIAEPSTAQICADALATGPDIRYGHIVRNEFPRKDVRVTATSAYTSMGMPFHLGQLKTPAVPEDMAYASQFVEMSRQLLEAGKLRPHRARVGDGLESVLDGIEALRAKKVSGEKLVYRV